MSLSILCVTSGEEHAGLFILRMKRLAQILQAELVLGLDSDIARKAGYAILADVAIMDLPSHDVPLQECVSDMCVNECHGDYVLRLDDDEVVSPALEKWLYEKGYEGGDLFAFPRVYMYPDDEHILCNDGIYPDLQTRLGLKRLMTGVNYIHAGNPNGCGQVKPYAIEHHKLLVKSFEQRKAIADRYEAIRVGAGSYPEYARYNLPEVIYGELQVKEYQDGDYSE